jgi:hypothetical protein
MAGARVTDLAPTDHKDHRGLFFAWHNLEFKKGEQVFLTDVARPSRDERRRRDDGSYNPSTQYPGER